MGPARRRYRSCGANTSFQFSVQFLTVRVRDELIQSGTIVATTRRRNHPNERKEATQMSVIAYPMPTARPQLDADLARAVLASRTCRIAIIQHRSVTARVDREQVEGRDGITGAIVDCGDADLLIT